MHRYKILSTIGSYHFGEIFKAENIENGQLNIIEEHKKGCHSWDECISIRQIKVLRVLNHPNIIKLKEIIRLENQLFLVFEYFEVNLQSWYNEKSDKKQLISEIEIRQIVFQIAQAINQCHFNGIVHRDLCPENIYINKDNFIKVGQFSNAEFYKKQNFTEYITTRWYRSPEAILKLPQGLKIDVWALGCIMAELYHQRPFFHGITEQDQLMRILKLMGIPNHKEYPEFHTLCQSKNIQIPHFEPIQLASILPNASPLAIDLLNQMLNVNPTKRISIQKVLCHPFFAQNKTVPIKEQQQKLEQIDLKKKHVEFTTQNGQVGDQLLINVSMLQNVDERSGNDGNVIQESDTISQTSYESESSLEQPSQLTISKTKLSMFGQNTPKNKEANKFVISSIQSKYNSLSNNLILPQEEEEEVLQYNEENENKKDITKIEALENEKIKLRDKKIEQKLDIK